MVYTIELRNSETPFMTKDGVPLYVVAEVDYVDLENNQAPSFWSRLVSSVKDGRADLDSYVREVLAARFRESIKTFDVTAYLSNLGPLCEDLVTSPIAELEQKGIRLVAIRILELEDKIGYLEAWSRLQAALTTQATAISEANRFAERMGSKSSSGDLEECEVLYRRGRLFELGQEEPKDEVKAIALYELAADMGSYKAREKLGWYQEERSGQWEVDSRYKHFARLKAEAEAGISGSQYQFGKYYYDGLAVDQNYQTAEEWFTKAAENGNHDALKTLFWMYSTGLGVPRNRSKALGWCRIGERRGLAWAQNELASMYRHGEGDISPDPQKAMELYERAAHQGDSHAQLQLGLMYDNGDGITQDYRKAANWYQLAAEKGNTTAQCNLAYLYEHGNGVVKDRKRAIELYEQASERGDTAARDYLTSLR